MSPQIGSVVLYSCAAVMGLLGLHRQKKGQPGYIRNFIMAGLMALFGFVISLSAG